MKKLIILLLCLIPFAAQAVELDWTGMFRTRTADITGSYWYNVGSEDPDVMTMTDYRLRLFTNAVFSENLKAVWGIEVNGTWGDGDQNRDEISVQTKHLYLDFTPDMADWLNVRVGLQGYRDPFGGAIFDEDAAGIFFMPKFESVDMTLGWYQFDNQDVTGHRDNMYVIQAGKDFDSFKLGTAILYDKGWMYPGALAEAMYEMIMLMPQEFDVIWAGLYGSYMTENMELGGHFVYNSAKWTAFFGSSDSDFTGWFAYLYGKYNMNDKLSMKLNFGYTPGSDYDEYEYNQFVSVKPYADLYGLEYFYPGAVYDGMSMFNGYGDWTGQMVLAANIWYDMFYLNAGMIRATFTDEDYDPRNIGTEIDLGFKYPVTDGLELCGVYAMFLPGDFVEDMFGNNDTAHELSLKLQYDF